MNENVKLIPIEDSDREQKFIELNGQTECSCLVSAHDILHKSCNDYVGDAAGLNPESKNMPVHPEKQKFELK